MLADRIPLLDPPAVTLSMPTARQLSWQDGLYSP